MNDEITFLPDEHYRFVDRRIRVRTNSEAARDRLRLMYARFRSDGEADDAPETLFQVVDRLETDNLMEVRDDHREYRLAMTGRFPHFTCQSLATGEFESVGFCDPLVLVQSTLLDAVAVASGRRAFLFHAGAVARGGKALLLSARSRMGKTTLVLNLLRRGCDFLSDEVAWLDPETGMVTPFPRKINMRRAGMDLLGLEPDERHTLSGVGEDGPEFAVDAEDIPGVRIAEPARAETLLFLKGFADQPILERVAPANAIFEFMNSAIGPLPDPGRALFEFAPVLDRLKCYNLISGETEPTTDMVMELLETEPNGDD